MLIMMLRIKMMMIDFFVDLWTLVLLYPFYYYFQASACVCEFLNLFNAFTFSMLIFFRYIFPYSYFIFFHAYRNNLRL